MIRGNWGDKVLKDLKRAAQTKSYSLKHYMGNGTVLILITYEALGMREDLRVLEDDLVLSEAQERRQDVHVTLRTAPAMAESTPPEEEPEDEVESQRRSFIRMGNIRVEVGSTERSKGKQKIF